METDVFLCSGFVPEGWSWNKKMDSILTDMIESNWTNDSKSNFKVYSI